MDPLPPLNALKAFDAVGRLGSITRAAEELCVSAAAVSQQIRALERFLGQHLFIRSHRALTPTSAGQQYHDEVARLFAGLRRATSGLTQPEDRPAFTIRAPHSVAMRWLLPRLAGFHQAHPGIDVRLSTSLQTPDFEREDLDAGICFGTGQWKGVQAYKLMENQVFPVCAPHKLGRLRRPQDLVHETLLHSSARPDDWQHWLRAAGLDQVNSARGPRYESSALAYEAALEGYGVVIAQRALIERDLAEQRLVAPFDLLVDLGPATYYVLLPPAHYKRRSAELDQFRAWIASLALADAVPAARSSKRRGSSS